MFVGLSNKSEIGSGAAQYVVPGDDFYFAEEVLGNITNEVVSGSTEISTEQPVTLKSELINQIGLKGGLLQEVTWIALSADRKTVIDTIDITKNEDGTVSVKPTSDTPLGDYVIAAYSEKYNACKGIDITVAEKKEINVKTFDFQQNLSQYEVLAEAERAAEIGLKTVIIDDGWEMDKSDVRFAYCGDWEVSKEKFPDFKGMINKIHDMGGKVILWVGTPYLGIESKTWNEMKDKTLQFSDWARAAILDPRYPDIREYIIEKLKRLVISYNLDGLKLDFIDLFYETEDSTYSDDMDFLSVQEAVDKLMVCIKDEVLKINPDMLIEFRQKYIGPNMRKYGNMFRVADCPDAYITNKVGVLDLRLLSGSTAVHSDMLIWNENE